MSPRRKRNKTKKKPKLLQHEIILLENGHLRDMTHDGSTAIWLFAESSKNLNENRTLLYRHMSDAECAYLLKNGQLPNTQPYQTIVEGPIGREYCEGYPHGLRKPSGNIVTTVVEFTISKALANNLFSMQKKIEDGCFSHGLGDKGGKGLPIFNKSLASGETTFRIVLVKRK